MHIVNLTGRQCPPDSYAQHAAVACLERLRALRFGSRKVAEQLPIRRVQAFGIVRPITARVSQTSTQLKVLDARRIKLKLGYLQHEPKETIALRTHSSGSSLHSGFVAFCLRTTKGAEQINIQPCQQRRRGAQRGPSDGGLPKNQEPAVAITEAASTPTLMVSTLTI